MTSPERSEEPAPATSRRPAVLWLVAGAALLCLLAVGGWIWHQAEAERARKAAAEKARVQAEAQKRADALRIRRGMRDCASCPEMLRVEPGSFVMGSPDTQHHRFDNEGPQQHVTIARAFWLGKYEVTVGEFATFVDATGYVRPRSPLAPLVPTDTWRNPGHDQTDRHPVVSLEKGDAEAYVAWLKRPTGRNYRLPSEAEWEYAARAGTTTAYSWGDDSREACSFDNVADLAFWRWAKGPRGDIVSCNDSHAEAAPVGTLQPNAWGFHDMLGNAQEWTSDCWNDSHAGRPANGEARTSGDCYRSALRGGSWLTTVGGFHAARRVDTRIGYTDSHVGFRVARDD